MQTVDVAVGALATSRSTGMLVGPGILAADAVTDLQATARWLGIGVVNTWGAKGVFEWDDPLHFGTAGLQAEDFVLAGLADVDVLLTCGLDDDEVTTRPWTGAALEVDVAAVDLPALRVPALDRSGAGDPPRPALYTSLAAVIGPLYEEDRSAARRARRLAGQSSSTTLVVGEPGLAGFWLARTFPTSFPGSVRVPAAGGRDAAWAAATEAASAGRDVTLVATEPPPRPLPGVRLEIWSPDVVDLDPAPLVAVAGPIVAWQGRDL